MNNKSKRGAKPGNQLAVKANPLDAGFSGRCMTSEKAAWTQAAEERNQSMNEWIRSVLNAASKKD